jgi:hypothetical protein
VTQAATTGGQTPIVTVEEQGRRREFRAADLPVTLGMAPDADGELAGVVSARRVTPA